jgi:hypothetical protein
LIEVINLFFYLQKLSSLGVNWTQFWSNIEKSFNNLLFTRFLKLGGEKQDMKTKTKALTLLSVVLVALVAGSIVFTLQSVKADTTSPVATDSETTLSVVNATDNGAIGFNGFDGGPMMMGIEPRFGVGHRGIDRGFGGFGSDAIQVSSDFTANVTNIANNDSDVQNLLNQGYNITSIHPNISTTVDGNGNVVIKASTAELTLIGTNGRALVVVDLSQEKVTKIVTLTVTQIDK